MKKTLVQQEDRIPTVTEIAQLGACERQLLFDHSSGRKRSGQLERKAKEGIRIHKKYEHMAKSGLSDSRCFIASEVYGEDAWQTCLFREFRDARLQPSLIGRCLVSVYYGFSPVVVKILRRIPGLKRPVRAVLQALADRIDLKERS